ncbi:integrase, partial [Shigella sonnei]|nr:integrase [Shigella sonnei]
NRRRRYSSYCGEIGPAPDNLIARDFKAEQPNQK